MTGLASSADGDSRPYLRLGERLVEARRSAGLTQGALARRLGISLWALDEMEQGRSDPEGYLVPISDTTGVSPWWPADTASQAETDGPESAETVAATSASDSGTRLVCGAIATLVVVRFFTEVVPVLPRALNFIDIPIFLALGLTALASTSKDIRARHVSLGGPALLFLALTVISVLVNLGTVAPAPVLVFIYGFLAPLGVYASVYRIWPAGNALVFSRALVALGVLQLVVVALIDVPRFVTTQNPDNISGTFGTNAYQLVFFLLIFASLLIGVATFERQRGVARFIPALLIATFATILLAQYRALLVGLVVAGLAVGILLGGRFRGFATIASAIVAFVMLFYYVGSNLPVLRLNSAISSLASSPGSYVSGRLGVAENVLRLYTDKPQAIVVGTGPGTYSSRAWQTFANANSTSGSNVAGKYATALTGGQAYSTDVSDRYVSPQIRLGKIVEGSRAVSAPYSSYTAPLAEIGVVGFIVVCLLYFGALRRVWRMSRVALRAPAKGDPLPAIVLATTVAFLTLVQLALLENWFEVTRVTFVVWAMLAVSSKELEARDRV